MWIICGGGRDKPVASSKEKEDIEWWSVSDVNNIWRCVGRRPSQAPKRRKT
jgi:hypothetical protein